MSAATTALIFAAALLPAPVHAWSGDPAVNTAVSTATDEQRLPAIASDGAGGSIVAWQDRRSGNDDVYVQRFNAAGAAQWAANGVALCTATGNQTIIRLVSDGAGGAVAAWQDARSGDLQIYARRVNAAGTPQWTADGVVLCTASSSQNVQLVPDGIGGATVCWNDFRNFTDFKAYAQRINGSGAVQWTANGVALSNGANSQYFPRIATDGSGGAIFAWQDNRNGNLSDIYAQRINSSGAVQWTAAGAAVSNAASLQSKPKVVSDGSGGAIIGWDDFRGGSNYDVYAQRVNASGAAQWTADGVVMAAAAGHQEKVQLAMDGSGGAIAIWEDGRSTIDIYAQRINASGAVQWTANGVAVCAAADIQLDPQLVSDGAGGAVATWSDRRDGTQYDIYAQRIGSTGVAQWTANGLAVCTAANSQTDSQLVADGPGGAVMVWTDLRVISSDIYAARVTAGGFLPAVVTAFRAE